MNKILFLCLVLTLSNTSARWTKESEEVTKDLKDEKENLKEAFSQWKENIAKRHTTTSTSTTPPTTTNNDELIEAIGEIKEELKNEIKERKEEQERTRKSLASFVIYHSQNLWKLIQIYDPEAKNARPLKPPQQQLTTMMKLLKQLKI